MEEVWMPWHKNPAYLVSNFGKVKGVTGKILSTTSDSHGYISLSTRMPNSRQATRTKVHRMILETFNPVENMEKLHVDHIDGNPANNHLTNLRWLTAEENNQIKAENRAPINEEVNRLIQKYGYNKVVQILQAID